MYFGFRKPYLGLGVDFVWYLYTGQDTNHLAIHVSRFIEVQLVSSGYFHLLRFLNGSNLYVLGINAAFGLKLTRYNTRKQRRIMNQIKGSLKRGKF